MRPTLLRTTMTAACLGGALLLPAAAQAQAFAGPLQWLATLNHMAGPQQRIEVTVRIDDVEPEVKNHQTTDFEAVRRVAEVDADGRVTRAEYTVTRFVETSLGETRELLRAGDVVIASRAVDGSTEYTLQGGEMPAETREALHQSLEFTVAELTGEESLDSASRGTERCTIETEFLSSPIRAEWTRKITPLAAPSSSF
jgi:hypothetical protein